MAEGRRSFWAVAGFPLVLFLIALPAWFFRGEIARIFASPEELKEWIAACGWWAPLVFVGIQFVQVVIFILPGEIAQIAGGYLFGAVLGTLYSIAGITIGSAFNFFIGWWLGAPFVRVVFGEERMGRFHRLTESPRAAIAFFLLFLLPGIPKDILCYVAGISLMRFPAFFMISMIGRLPGILGSTIIGDAAADSQWGLVVGISIAAGILFLLGLRYQKRIHDWIEKRVSRREE